MPWLSALTLCVRSRRAGNESISKTLSEKAFASSEGELAASNSPIRCIEAAPMRYCVVLPSCVKTSWISEKNAV